MHNDCILIEDWLLDVVSKTLPVVAARASVNMFLSIALLSFLTCLGSPRTLSNTRSDQQQLFSNELSRPWGTNNATYGPVPEVEQLSKIEWLEIAPSPILV